MTCSCKKSTHQYLAAILVIIIIGALTLVAYTGEQDALRSATALGMKGTAGVMATQVHGYELANITPGNENARSTLRSSRDSTPCGVWMTISSTPIS